MPIKVPARTNALVQRVTAILLTIAIFVVDTFTPLGIAIAVLYALVIILGAAFLDRRGLLAVAGICVVFTLIGFFAGHGFLGHGESFYSDAAIRCVISLCAIVLTTVLAIKNQEATRQLMSQAALLDLTHDAIFVRDVDNVITYWNRGAEELYGWTAQEALGRKATDLLQTRCSVELAHVQEVFLRTGRWEGEVLHIGRDGTEIMVGSRWSLYRDQHGRPVATMETNSDISGHREAEDALRKAQAELSHVARIMTLGELTASIAHEINQPLAAIMTNGEAGLRWLGREPPNNDAVGTSLEKMIGNARRASDVIARLRAMARRSTGEHVQLNINDVVKDTLLLVQREVFDRRVFLDLSFDPSEPEVFGDRIQLQQVIINLIMNALQAMEQVNGRKMLRLVTRQEASENGNHVVLEVTDTGTGFDTDAAANLFTAFYSTKSDGMGIGLSISRSIVEAHHGQISASANDGAGATFKVRLPSFAAGDS
jgi:PAS domain S-box-containing protein